jgi:hypothetical protein
MCFYVIFRSTQRRRKCIPHAGPNLLWQPGLAKRVQVTLHDGGILPRNRSPNLGDGCAWRNTQKRGQCGPRGSGLAELFATCRQEAMGGREFWTKVNGPLGPFGGFLVALVCKVSQPKKRECPVICGVARAETQRFLEVRPRLVALARKRVVSTSPHITEREIGVDLERGLQSSEGLRTNDLRPAPHFLRICERLPNPR